MTDKVIRVNVTASKSQKVTVSSSKVANEITASPDTSAYYSRLAKNWAIAEGLVENIDYSSKHYAQESKASADMAKTYEISTQENYNMFMESSFNANSELQTNRDGALADIESAKTSAIDSLNSIKDENISTIESKANEEIENLNKEIEQGKDEIKDTIDGIKVLTTLEIGDIGIAPLGIDETKGKRRYLNGQLIIQEQYVQFTNKVKSAVALYPSLACTESEWQTTATMTVGGQVGKFVVDNDAGTIRLPKIIMPIQGLTDLSKLGQIVEAGLPNITGSISSYTNGIGSDPTGSGSLTTSKNGDGWQAGNLSRMGEYILGLDASLSNPIYNNSNTVQQEQIQYPYFIQVATGAETEDNIINEIELNNPFSFGDSKYSPKPLNNLSWLKSEGQWNSKAVYPSYYDWALTNFNNGVEGFALSTGEYTDYDVVINTTDETFRLPLLDGSEDLPSDRYVDLTLGASGDTYTAPANGWLYIWKEATAVGQYVLFTNQTSPMANIMYAPTSSTQCRMIFPLKKGNIVRVDYTLAGGTRSFRFLYAKGNGSLYFYVGETVQNANLINAGRIEEKIASIIPDNSSLISGYGMPSSKYIDLTLGASGTTYTAPANGWVTLWKAPTADGQALEAEVGEGRLGFASIAKGTTWLRLSFSVKKGDNYIIAYSANGPTQLFRFIYAQGEV